MINQEEKNMQDKIIATMLSGLDIALEGLSRLSVDEQVDAVNQMRAMIHARSPFAQEPVDYVKWVKAGTVEANDYNPNSVAPPEMELLRHSIMSDGYTQPIVANAEDERLVVIDGFHRNRVGKECKDVAQRVLGYLPIVQIKESQTGKADRMASTIRHNRARGKHRVDAMSDIVEQREDRERAWHGPGRGLALDPNWRTC
jgi:ParB-like chromosome segregation protein Spo0J